MGSSECSIVGKTLEFFLESLVGRSGSAGKYSEAGMLVISMLGALVESILGCSEGTPEFCLLKKSLRCLLGLFEGRLVCVLGGMVEGCTECM